MSEEKKEAPKAEKTENPIVAAMRKSKVISSVPDTHFIDHLGRTRSRSSVPDTHTIDANGNLVEKPRAKADAPKPDPKK